MERGNPQVQGEGGKLRQRLQGCISTPITQPDPMPGKKIPGGNASCPACTDTCPALVPGQAGAFGFLQFGIHIQGGLCHFMQIAQLLKSKRGWGYAGGLAACIPPLPFLYAMIPNYPETWR